MPPVVAAVTYIATSIGAVTAANAIAFLGSVWFNVVSWAVMIGGSVGYSRAQQRKLKKAANAQAEAAALRKMNLREAADTGKLILGQVRMGGTMFFVEQTGTKKEYTHVAIAHACHECDSFVKHYLNDEEVTLDGAGVVTSGKFTGLVTIKNYLGTDGQAVSADLQTAVGAGVWTNDHRARGWCWTYMKCKTDYDVFTGGLPTYSADIRGAKAYDPRTATTAWTQNAALLTRWYLALGRTRGGVGATAGELPDSYWNAAANVCDESVNLNGGGTEARYTINGVIDTAAAPGEVLAGLLAAMAGIMPYVNGQFCVRAGAHASTVMDLGPGDVVGPIELHTRDSLRETFNGVKGLYLSEKNNWQPADFPPVVNATYTAEDGGERIWEDVTLNFTTSSATAQRLAKIMLERSRQDFTFTAAFKLKALNLIPGDVVTLTMDRYGFAGKLFEVVQTALRLEAEGDVPVLKCYLTLRETAAAVWDWNSGEETTVDIAPNTTLVDRYSVPTPSGFSAAVAAAADRTVLPRIRLSWTEPADALVTNGGYTEVEYKKAADADWTPWSRIPGSATFDFVSDLERGTSFDFRIRHMNRHGIRSDWSATETETAPASQADAGELVFNPDFSLGDIGWGTFAGYWTLANNLGEGGAIWGAQVNNVGAFQLVNDVFFPVTSGERLSLRAHGKGVNGSARITIFDDANNEVFYINTTSNFAAGWSYREGVGTVPQSGVKARAEFLPGGDTNTTVDSIIVQRIPSGVAYTAPEEIVPPVQWDYTDLGGGSREVTLTNDDGAATIKYQVNGGAVTAYAGPFTVSQYDLVTAYAERGGYVTSEESRAVLP